MSEHLLVRQDGPVLHVQLNRLDKRNALTQAMYTGMADAMEEAATSPACRVVLLSGDETCFTSGNDIRDFMAGGLREDSPVVRFLQVISGHPKPIIAAAAGPAIGVGTTMLFHCDLVYAAPDLALKTPFVDLALVPEAASSLLMPAGLGYQRAAGMLMLGEVLSAEEAHVAGLVNRVVPNAELLATAMERAQHLATRPPEALRLTKQLMRKSDQSAVQARMREEAQHFAQRLMSPEAMEAFGAFMEQRAPDFSKFA